MKTNKRIETGTVLMTALMTCTVLSMICATSLYVATQNTTSCMQTASWQQALTGAETAVDHAISALNDTANGTAGAWTNWLNVTGSLPGTQPTGGTAITRAPLAGEYNYLIPGAMTYAGEGNTVTSWVTVDTVGNNLIDTKNRQWYRLRATGQASAPGLYRASSNRLDNALRNTLFFRYNRKSGQSVSASPQVTRTVEVIMQPLGTGGWAEAILAQHSITMSGGAWVDSFDSSNPFKSTNGQYDQSKRQSHGDIATLATYDSNPTHQDSNLNSTDVWGNLSYSGPAVKNITHVHGTISTPFSAPTPTPPADPSWPNGQVTTMTLNSTQTLTGGPSNTSQANSKKIKTNGDLNLSGSNVLTLAPYVDPGTGQPVDSYFEIWVPGQFVISGQAQIVQQAHVFVTMYVDNAINLSGGSVTNGNNVASSLLVNGTWDPSAHNGSIQAATFSGGQAFIGVINAPGYNFNISGNASYSGAFIGYKFTISGGGGVHYDEALKPVTGNPTIGNYAFASWFEDNSDPTKKDSNGHYIVY